MQTIAIVNARLVNEGQITEGDVIVRDGRIAQIGSGLATDGCDRVIDAAGRHLLPGIIDDQVHFREPGVTDKADIWHESRAAVAGGTTSVMEMPNTRPSTTTIQALEDKHALASRKSAANYAFYLGGTNTNLDVIQRLKPNQAAGVKVFMGASTGNMLVDDAATLAGIFRDAPCLIATHCEDTPTILAREAAARERWGEDVPIREHATIRSREACYASSSLAISLAKEHDANLHVLHLTTAEELAQFTAGPMAGKKITAEVCIHHLWFTSADYLRLGAQIKCNPAVKELRDREALRRAVRDDIIDVIATDHAPHTWQEKHKPYFSAPSGLPLVQHSLHALAALVQQGVFTLERVVQKACHAPAMRYQVKERGFLREGYWADLTLVDFAQTTTVHRRDELAKCGWSPFEGQTFPCRVDATLVNGRVAYENGQIIEGHMGQRLEFSRCRR